MKQKVKFGKESKIEEKLSGKSGIESSDILNINQVRVLRVVKLKPKPSFTTNLHETLVVSVEVVHEK